MSKQIVMILSKEVMSELPQRCDFCFFYSKAPDTFTGWKDMCNLTGERIGDSAGEGWQYQDGARPKHCPLVEIDLESDEC